MPGQEPIPSSALEALHRGRGACGSAFVCSTKQVIDKPPVPLGWASGAFFSCENML